jgi:phage-related protein
MVAALTALGNLAVRIKGLGIAKTGKQLSGFQKSFGNMQKKMGPALKALGKMWLKFGAIASGALAAMTAASPLLRAQMHLIGIRAQQIVRIFGDALAPVFKLIGDLIKDLYEWFTALPQPMQDAIVFGTNLSVALGLLALAFGGLVLAINPISLIFLALIAVGSALHLAWTENFGGIQDLIMRFAAQIKPIIEKIQDIFNRLIIIIVLLLARAKPIFDTLGGVISTVFGTVGGVIDDVIIAIDGLVSAFGALLSGDLAGFLDGLVNLFVGIVAAIIDALFLVPRALLDIVDYLTGGIVTDFVNAGASLVEGFFNAIGDALANVDGWIGEFLNIVMDFFGGSLPERGPLKDIDRAGFEFGQAYIMNIGKGLERGNISRTMYRTLNIRSVNVLAGQSDLDDTRKFGSRISSDVRRSRRW